MAWRTLARSIHSLGFVNLRPRAPVAVRLGFRHFSLSTVALNAEMAVQHVGLVAHGLGGQAISTMWPLLMM